MSSDETAYEDRIRRKLDTLWEDLDRFGVRAGAMSAERPGGTVKKTSQARETWRLSRNGEDPTTSSKTAYQERIRAKLETLRADMDRFSARAGAMDAERRAGALDKIEEASEAWPRSQQREEPMTADKTAYHDRMRAKLDGLKAEMDRLSAKAREMSAEGRIEAGKKLEEVKEAWHRTQDRLESVRESAAGQWQAISESVDAAWATLQQKYREANERAEAAARDQ